MFDTIADRYDFLNHFLSLGIDYYWRRFSVRRLRIGPASLILDCATGTCDCAIEAARYSPTTIVGIDISMNMLRRGKKKFTPGTTFRIDLVNSSTENLAFKSGCFDGVMAAFGVRNFFDLEKGLKQIYRVLKQDGHFVVLEFSKPRLFPVKQLYFFYFRWILPILGRMISKNKSAYSYLPVSVMDFPEGDAFIEKLTEAGFRNLSSERLTFGIVTVYHAVK